MLRVPQPHPGHKQRGRGSCTVSERPTVSLFVSPSLFRPLTPLFPLHTRHSPVSPMIPTLTQKHGDGGLGDPSKTMIPSTDRFRLSSPGDFNRLEEVRTALEGSPNTSIEPSLSFFSDLLLATSLPAAASAEEGHSSLATASSFLRPAFTTTSIAIVGAPTFLSLAPPLSFFPIFLNLKLTTDNLKLTNTKPAIGVQADERPGPNSERGARQIRRHSQATAAPCPCVRGIQGG